jgi:hypothetical protein
MTKTEQLIMDIIKGIKNVSFEKKSYTFDFKSYQADKTVVYYRNIIEPNKFLIAQLYKDKNKEPEIVLANSILYDQSK